MMGINMLRPMCARIYKENVFLYQKSKVRMPVV